MQDTLAKQVLEVFTQGELSLPTDSISMAAISLYLEYELCRVRAKIAAEEFASLMETMRENFPKSIEAAQPYIPF